MAIAVLIDLPGGSQDLYEAVVRELGPAGQSVAAVPGLLVHAAGPIEGGWRVIDLWESQEALDRFRQEDLMPASERAGATQRPSVEVMPLYRFLK